MRKSKGDGRGLSGQLEWIYKRTAPPSENRSSSLNLITKLQEHHQPTSNLPKSTLHKLPAQQVRQTINTQSNMYFASATTLALIAALPLALSTPILEARQNGVTCQTSSASPTTGDVTDVINQIRGDGGICLQTNDAGSDCTTLVSHNGAAISVCGGVDDDTSGTSCADVAAFANQIQQTCKRGDPVRVGGTYTVSASKRIEVIAS